MEQNPAPDPVLAAHNAADLRRMATATATVPHTRLALLLAAHGLNDDAAAGLLQVSRPVVTRTRLGARPPSFDVAARIAAVFGIPATDWLTLPRILHQHRAALDRAADARAKEAKGRARKAA